MRVQNIAQKRHGLAFTQSLAVTDLDYVREFRAAYRRLTFGNRRFVVARLIQLTEGCQSYRGDGIGWRAEIVFLRILFVVGRAFETPAVAAEEIDPLRLVREWLELKWQRLIAGLEFQLLAQSRLG